MKQKIICTALPNGVINKGSSSTYKASLALSLQVEDVNTTLQNVPDMLHWAEKIKTGKFIVYINGKATDAIVTSPEVDNQLWNNLFSPTVKVKSFVQEDYSQRPIVSYPVKHIVNFVKNIVEDMGKKFAEDLPDSNYYTDNQVFTAISDYSLKPYPQRGPNMTHVAGMRGEKITMNEIITNKHIEERLDAILRKNKTIPFNQNPSPTLDFAQLKNFHGLYNHKEVQSFHPLQKPDFEFHEILSVIAAYPQLLRKLGLVFDVEFAMPTNMIAITPNIRIAFTDVDFSSQTTVSCPPTAYQATKVGFYTKPDSESLIDKGHLKLNTSAFTVFQLDTDGAGLKLCQMIDNLQLRKAKHIFYAVDNFIPNENLIPVFNNQLPPKEGLPTQNSTGIAVAKNGMAEQIHAKFIAMNALKPALIANGIATTGLHGNNANYILPNKFLFADDLNMGYRMDVQPEDAGGKWFSLHKRNNTYSFINSQHNKIEIPDMPVDEGYIQIGAAEEDTGSGKRMKIGEVLARWDGWSLSVPPVGSALNDPMLDNDDIHDKSNPAAAAKEADKYRTPDTADFKLNVVPSVAEGSLPMLRFGKKYSLKIRTVDVAGNSVNENFAPENATEAIVPKIKYMRYEPVNAPFLLLGNEMKAGESSEMLVIRSNENVSTKEYEQNVGSNKYPPEAVRHIKPPRCTVERATAHEKLDKGFGKTNAAQAASYYQKIIADKDPLISESNNTPDLTVFDPNVKTMDVEYLVDPMAAGVCFYISANDPNPKLPNPDKFTKRISFYFDDEVTTAALANKTNTTEEWFDPKTFRVRLKEGSPDVIWESTSRTLVITLQKGAIFKMNYACFWRPDELVKISGILHMMGLNNLSGTVGQRIEKGQHWMFSPWREITFVHAVQQPLSKVLGKNYPEIVTIEPERDFGDNFTLLNTKLMVHGPSTGQIDITADWDEWIDDVTKPALEITQSKGKVVHFTTPYLWFEYIFGPLVKNNIFPGLKHIFNDTKHRFVNYSIIATTRYREYFFNLIQEKGDTFKLTTEGNTVTKVNILSSARPVAPQLEYVIPTFEWNRKTNGNKTVTGRISGLRIYMKRPWYSSGEGQQLGVILYMPPVTDNIPGSKNTTFTTWGTDPTKLSAALPNKNTPSLNHFINLKQENKDIVATPEDNTAKVYVAAFDVKYDTDRELYYADIMFNIGVAYYPFVRLALAAYQKHSVRKEKTDCCISPIVQADYIQIPAPRTSSIDVGSSNNQVTVAIGGTLPKIERASFNGSRVEFVIEPLDIAASEETHISIHKPIESYQYTLQINDVNNYIFYHSHQFNLPSEYASKPYRIKVLEYELITYDPLKPNPNPGNVVFASMPKKERLVFADVYEVNK